MKYRPSTRRFYFSANGSVDRLKQYKYLRIIINLAAIIIILLCCRPDFRIGRILFKFLIGPHKSVRDENMCYSLSAVIESRCSGRVERVENGWEIIPLLFLD